jgi:hypothetical protein
MKNVFLSAAASGGLNEPLLSTQALDRAFSPLQAQASCYYFSSPVSHLTLFCLSFLALSKLSNKGRLVADSSMDFNVIPQRAEIKTKVGQ